MAGEEKLERGAEGKDINNGYSSGRERERERERD